MKRDIILAAIMILLALSAWSQGGAAAFDGACGGPPACKECHSNVGTYSGPDTEENRGYEHAEDAAQLAVNNYCLASGGTPTGITYFYDYTYKYRGPARYDLYTVYAKRTCDRCGQAPDPCEGVTCGDFVVGGDPNQPPSPCCPSPIIVDLAGDGFDLTDAAGGVNFDLRVDGRLERVAWTAPSSDDAFLVLDRNGNGRVDDGSELFGDRTFSGDANGFLALAEYDKPEFGGNMDGRIDASDAVYLGLRLWRDSNHNGYCERAEMLALTSAGLSYIELEYRASAKRDRWGNGFRFRAKVGGTSGQKFAYDVFFVR